MKILKTKKIFTYMVVGALVMALSISCKSNEEPSTFKVSDLVGTWTGGGNSFSISSSGALNFNYAGTTYSHQIYNMEDETQSIFINVYDSTYNDNATHSDGATRKCAIFSFDSSSSCTVYIREDKYSGTYPDGSWQQGSDNSIGTFTK